jgi:hypothetical protein
MLMPALRRSELFFDRPTGDAGRADSPGRFWGIENRLVDHSKISKNFSGLFMPLCYIPAPLNEVHIGQTLIAGRN